MDGNLFPIYVEGEVGVQVLAAILRGNGFVLRCDKNGRTVAEPQAPGAFNLVRCDNLPKVLVPLTLVPAAAAEASP